MRKKISEMTDIDKAVFLKQVKQLGSEQYGFPWEYIEKKIRKNLEDTFDDEKFAKWILTFASMLPAPEKSSAIKNLNFADRIRRVS